MDYLPTNFGAASSATRVTTGCAVSRVGSISGDGLRATDLSREPAVACLQSEDRRLYQSGVRGRVFRGPFWTTPANNATTGVSICLFDAMADLESASGCPHQ